MFKIREEQHADFVEQRKISFRARLFSSLVRDFPENEYHLTPSEIEVRMDKALTDASERGMVSKADYIRYAYIVVALGPELETNPEYHATNKILLSRRSGTAKLDLIKSEAMRGA